MYGFSWALALYLRFWPPAFSTGERINKKKGLMQNEGNPSLAQPLFLLNIKRKVPMELAVKSTLTIKIQFNLKFALVQYSPLF